MRTRNRIVVAAAVAMVFAAGTVMAQQPPPRGPGTHLHDHGSNGHEAMIRQGVGSGMDRGPVGMLTSQDANSAADMGIAMNLVHESTRIRRTVTRLPDGIRNVCDGGRDASSGECGQGIWTHAASRILPTKCSAS